jgi:NitT/TauT family transport system ATP-binding protein
LIAINHVFKTIKGKTLFKDFSLSVNKGEFISIIGPSGCGKSSLLRLLAGLDSPSKGEIIYPKNIKISYVFQDAALIPWLTVLENINLAIPFASPQLEISSKNKIEEILALVKLSGFESYFPHELSGGMKMRVSIARALVSDPELLLMDEPFSSLDEIVRNELQDDLWDYWDRKKINIFFVTHSISEAVFLSQKLLIFNRQTIEYSQCQSQRTPFFRLNPHYLNEVSEFSNRLRSYV